MSGERRRYGHVPSLFNGSNSLTLAHHQTEPLGRSRISHGGNKGALPTRVETSHFGAVKGGAARVTYGLAGTKIVACQTECGHTMHLSSCTRRYTRHCGSWRTTGEVASTVRHRSYMNVQTTAARVRAHSIMARAESTNNSHRPLLDVVREGPDRRKVKDGRTEAR